MIYLKAKDFLHISVIEGAHDHGRQTVGRSLQIHVLDGEPDLYLYVAAGPLAIFSGRAFVDPGDDQNGRCIPDTFLSEGG